MDLGNVILVIALVKRGAKAYQLLCSQRGAARAANEGDEREDSCIKHVGIRSRVRKPHRTIGNTVGNIPGKGIGGHGRQTARDYTRIDIFRNHMTPEHESERKGCQRKGGRVSSPGALERLVKLQDTVQLHTGQGEADVREQLPVFLPERLDQKRPTFLVAGTPTPKQLVNKRNEAIPGEFAREA